jgi:hypothetical protein
VIAGLARFVLGLSGAASVVALSFAAEAPGAVSTAREVACRADRDCGYDPDRDACDSDPRSNRQPPLRDQGVLCYCDAESLRCATLRVPPVPCEGDASCAVNPSPRPHPVAADSTHLHEKGRVCRDFTISTTCERTNICTMNVHDCPDGKGARR